MAFADSSQGCDLWVPGSSCPATLSYARSTTSILVSCFTFYIALELGGDGVVKWIQRERMGMGSCSACSNLRLRGLDACHNFPPDADRRRELRPVTCSGDRGPRCAGPIYPKWGLPRQENGP